MAKIKINLRRWESCKPFETRTEIEKEAIRNFYKVSAPSNYPKNRDNVTWTFWNNARGVTAGYLATKVI